MVEQNKTNGTNFEIISKKETDAIYGSCIKAVIKNGNKTMIFSKYKDEKEYYLDNLYNGLLPIFVHGLGSRCTVKQVATGKLHELIENTETGFESN